MKFFKPIAISSAAAVALVASISAVASASATPIAADSASCNNQQHMANALASFRQARSELDHAEHNKGGWKDDAIRQADAAIKATERGCAFDDRH